MACGQYALFGDRVARREGDLFLNFISSIGGVFQADQPGHGGNGVDNSFDNSIHKSLKELVSTLAKRSLSNPAFLVSWNCQVVYTARQSTYARDWKFHFFLLRGSIEISAPTRPAYPA